MNINDKREKDHVCAFKYIKPGQVFEHMGRIFIKLSYEIKNDHNWYNAARLFNSELYSFTDIDAVKLLNAKLVIEDYSN